MDTVAVTVLTVRYFLVTERQELVLKENVHQDFWVPIVLKVDKICYTFYDQWLQ